ncbi:MAG: hypothetical protein M1814_000661 [Vezdaea aestivalis]|nr:MAG: hypothetical protein M1814_000661 [Vezdaea aestivalis]
MPLPKPPPVTMPIRRPETVDSAGEGHNASVDATKCPNSILFYHNDKGDVECATSVQLSASLKGQLAQAMRNCACLSASRCSSTASAEEEAFLLPGRPQTRDSSRKRPLEGESHGHHHSRQQPPRRRRLLEPAKPQSAWSGGQSRAPSTGWQDRSTHDVHLKFDDKEEVRRALVARIEAFQALNVKKILKRMFKAIQPDKQSLYPYARSRVRSNKEKGDDADNSKNGREPDSDHDPDSDSDFDPLSKESKRPPWWAPNTEYKEPDHLQKRDATENLLHTLFLYEIPEAIKGCALPERMSWVENLRKSCESLGENPTHIKDSDKRTQWEERHWPILQAIFRIARHAEAVFVGECRKCFKSFPPAIFGNLIALAAETILPISALPSRNPKSNRVIKAARTTRKRSRATTTESTSTVSESPRSGFATAAELDPQPPISAEPPSYMYDVTNSNPSYVASYANDVLPTGVHPPMIYTNESAYDVPAPGLHSAQIPGASTPPSPQNDKLIHSSPFPRSSTWSSPPGGYNPVGFGSMTPIPSPAQMMPQSHGSQFPQPTSPPPTAYAHGLQTQYSTQCTEIYGEGVYPERQSQSTTLRYDAYSSVYPPSYH